MLLSVLFLIASTLAADFECEVVHDRILATDTDGIEFKVHSHDVAAYRAEHPFGPRDFAPLHLDVAMGTHCFNFGSIRDFESAMGPTGIVVSVEGIFSDTKLSTDYNTFMVGGLAPGAEVVIELIQPIGKLLPGKVRRVTGVGISDWSEDYGHVPRTMYEIDINNFTTWRVVERRVYTVPEPQIVEDPEEEASLPPCEFLQRDGCVDVHAHAAYLGQQCDTLDCQPTRVREDLRAQYGLSRSW